MKNLLVFVLVVCAACKTPKPAGIHLSLAKLYRIKVAFKLNTENYDHAFTITNQGEDTISITRPGIHNSTSFLTLIDTTGNLRQQTCYTSRESGIDWMELPPHAPVQVKADADLKQQFCVIVGNELLAYRYTGYFKLP